MAPLSSPWRRPRAAGLVVALALLVGAASASESTSASASDADCPEMYYSPVGEEGCVQCWGNTRRRRASLCTACTVGRVPGGNSDDCRADCRSGYFEDNESKYCTGCFDGVVRRRRAESCTLCEPGTIRKDFGHDECVECAAGRYQSGNYCGRCYVGVTRRRRATSCTACPNGTGSGATDDPDFYCAECGPGKYSLFGRCDTCYQASNRRRASECKSCPEASDGIEWRMPSEEDEDDCEKIEGWDLFVTRGGLQVLMFSIANCIVCCIFFICGFCYMQNKRNAERQKKEAQQQQQEQARAQHMQMGAMQGTSQQPSQPTGFAQGTPLVQPLPMQMQLQQMQQPQGFQPQGFQPQSFHN